MCNLHRPTTAHSPRQADPGFLVKPSVPVADSVDGLIKTADLLTDVVVNFPLWPNGAQPNDKYELYLNGETVGDPKYIPDPVPAPGTLLSLTIPITEELKEDGIYSLTYTVSPFPGGTPDHSDPTYIIVDRTAPGAHQLGYMDFPDEARDGLTAVELVAMGNVLTGKIFGYTGLNGGDIIQTYWGTTVGPSITLNGTEDESGSLPIEISFEKSFLLALGNVAEPTHYTVTDRAGNTSAPSKNVTIPLFLTEVTPGLAAPIIQNYDGLIDYNDAQNRVQVQIPGSTLVEEGDLITLHWGPLALGPFPVATDDLELPTILLFDVDFATIALGGDGSIELTYDVVRSNNIVGLSAALEIEVFVKLPVTGFMDKPTVRGASSMPSAEDNLIDENDFELNATAIINWNTQFNSSSVITVYWGGQEVLDHPYSVTNSDVAAARPLLLTALNSKFKPVGTGPDIRVYYTVASILNPNVSTSIEQGIIVRSKDELPGGPQGADAPEFTALNEEGAINVGGGLNGAPVFIKPYTNIKEGQTITFTYEAFDKLIAGNLKFKWEHTSLPLNAEQIISGYEFHVDRNILMDHCFGHAEAYFQIQSDNGPGTSKRASVYVDMRTGTVCIR